MSLQGSLRTLGRSISLYLRSRARLAALEFRIEKIRTLQTLAVMIVGVFGAVLGLALLAAGGILALWPEDPIKALVVTGVVLLLFSILILLIVVWVIRHQPLPFEETMRQFEEEKTWLTD